jgi:chloramphenicol O-acetyltransferase type A
MKIINIDTWNRKLHYHHFVSLADPFFAVMIPFNVTKANCFAKSTKKCFFARYLHDCMKAINAVENLRYRIENDKVVEYDIIQASTTLMRADNTLVDGYHIGVFSNKFQELLNL